MAHRIDSSAAARQPFFFPIAQTNRAKMSTREIARVPLQSTSHAGPDVVSTHNTRIFSSASRSVSGPRRACSGAKPPNSQNSTGKKTFMACSQADRISMLIGGVVRLDRGSPALSCRMTSCGICGFAIHGWIRRLAKRRFVGWSPSGLESKSARAVRQGPTFKARQKSGKSPARSNKGALC